MANTTPLPIDESSARERTTDLATDRDTDRAPVEEPRRDPVPAWDEPRIDRIARRAHEIYQLRGGEHGRDLEDWLQAERDIDSDRMPRD